jgi:hypothetical protein
MLLFLIMYSVADSHIKIKFLSIKLYYQLTDCINKSKIEL